jgi:hypothetical protein
MLSILNSKEYLRISISNLGHFIETRKSLPSAKSFLTL